MQKILSSLFDTTRYTSLLDRERAAIVYTLSGVTFILVTLFAVLNRNDANQTIIEQAGTNPNALISAVIGYVASIAAWWLVRRKRLSLASLVMLLTIATTMAVPAISEAMYSPTYGFGISLIVVLGVLLLQYRGLALGLGLALGITALGIANRAQVPPPARMNDMTSMINASVVLLGIAAIGYLLLRYARISRTEGAKTISAERLRLAELTSQIAQRISRRMPLPEVLNNAVEQIRTEFPQIYHAQIFLIDDSKQNARLVASTGEVGRLLIERQHSLPVGSLSVIGQVTANRRSIVARAGSSDGVHRRNEFLPETAVEAAFPLRIGAAIIGALDLQSKQPDTFHDEDIPVFQSLADHIAIAIDNARLFDETERRLEENRQLAEQTQKAAREVERLNQQLTRRLWDDFLAQTGGVKAVTVDFDTRSTSRENEWTLALVEAVEANQPVQHQQDNVRIIAVPLRVRGQVVGAMEFELDASGHLSPEDLSLIQQVGERLGVAAETTRLFEASTSAAQREALVNEIAARLQASNTVETTLTAAARSLKDSIKASRVAIRLGTPPNQVLQDNGS
ncbi:MAG: GAF domain-containing protein [Chloroflexi bacterium]|nr:GAF domain-containing protein [Chloroflexota bacterium]